MSKIANDNSNAWGREKALNDGQRSLDSVKKGVERLQYCTVNV